MHKTLNLTILLATLGMVVVLLNVVAINPNPPDPWNLAINPNPPDPWNLAINPNPPDPWNLA